MANNKKEILEEAISNLEKQHWKGTVMKMGDNSNLWGISTFHSGSYMIDTILWWGYAEGRVIEIFWPESSWKTTLALHAIAEVQKQWEFAAFIDAEHALDPSYARNLWVDVDNLLLSQTDYWEQALQIAEELAKTWAVKLLVIDSVAALVPKTEVEWEMWDTHVGLQARLMSQWLRKLASILAKTWTTAIFLNQIRSKIGVMFWNPETTTWWNALKFFGSQRVEIRRGEKIEANKEQTWYKAKVKVVKNKIAPPFKQAEVPIMFNVGIDKTTDLIEAWLSYEVLERKWAFYTIGDQKVQWKDKLISYLNENEEIRNKLEEDIVTKIKNIRMWKWEIPENEETSFDEPIDENNKEADQTENN